jgi:hypothetical protein
MKNSSDTIGNRTRDLPAKVSKKFILTSQESVGIYCEFRIYFIPMCSEADENILYLGQVCCVHSHNATSMWIIDNAGNFLTFVFGGRHLSVLRSCHVSVIVFRLCSTFWHLLVKCYMLAFFFSVCTARQWFVLDASTWMAYCTFVVGYGAAHVSVQYGPSECRERCT